LILGTITVLVSSAILDSLSETDVLIKTLWVVVTLNAAANAFNDYIDLESDRINQANRPLPLGKISPNVALWSSFFLFGTGIVVSGFINLPAFIIATFIAIPLMVSYSLWLKGLPLIGNVVVSFILGLTFVFTGAAFGQIWGLLTPAFLALGFTLIRELVKDVADIEGDKAMNLKTFPIHYGIDPSIRLTIFFIVLLCFSALYPYWMGIYGKGYLIVLVLGIEIPLLFIVFLIVCSPSIRTCKLVSQILKACVFAGLLAVYLG